MIPIPTSRAKDLFVNVAKKVVKRSEKFEYKQKAKLIMDNIILRNGNFPREENKLMETVT